MADLSSEPLHDQERNPTDPAHHRCFATVAAVLAMTVGYFRAPRPAPHTTALAAADLGPRVLVIAPHPDDETLVTGGVIHHLIASGAKVHLVIVSAGDGYFRATKRLTDGPVDATAYRLLGDTRHAEGARATAELGLSPSDVTFLGYPDKSVYPMWDASWDATSPYTGSPGTSVVSYDWAQRPGAANCGNNLAEDLIGTLRDFKPDTVITPDTHETHNDHAAIGAFAAYAMDEVGFTGRRLTDVVHYKLYPRPSAFIPGSTLSPPPALGVDGAVWRSIALDPADEQAKRRALDRYPSQLAVRDLAIYMRAFVRRNELFCETAAARPTAAPTDAVPGSGTTGTVSVTPRPVVAPLYNYAARVDSLRMVRGPGVLWVAVMTDRQASVALDYRVSLRLIGGAGAPARVDVLVHGGVATAQRASAQSVLPDGITAVQRDDTTWIGIPASVLAGRTNALLGASVGPAGRPPFRTAWREVAL